MNKVFTGICIASLLLFTFTLSAFSQSGQEYGLPRIINYAPKDYAGEPINWALIQDDRGIIYAGNIKTLLEFDGAYWRQITYQGEPIGARCFAKDKNGRIYIGGKKRFGFLSLDSIGNTVYNSLLDSLPEMFRDFEEIWGIHLYGETMYLNTHSKLIALDPGGLKKWDSPSGFHMSAFVHGKLYAREWEKGLMVLEDDELKLISGGEMFASERIYTMLPFKEDGLILGTVNMGFWTYENDQLKKFHTGADEIISKYQIYLPGLVLPNGDYVIGTIGGGCLILNDEGKLIQHIDRNSGLQDGSVLYPFLDKSGVLWLALSKGISRVDINSPFTFFNEKQGLESGIGTFARYKGELFVGGTLGALKYNPDKKRFEQIEGVGIQNFDMKVFDGELLFTSYTGLAKYNNGKAIPIRKSVNRDFVLFGVEQSKANKQRYYVFTGDDIGTMYKTSTGQWIDEGFISEFDSADFAFRFGYETKEGEWWSGTAENGVLRLWLDDVSAGPNQARFKYKIYGPDKGIKEKRTTVFEVDGSAVVLTENGCYKYIEDQDTFIEDQRFNDISEFVKKPNTVIIEDKNKRLWIAGDGLVMAEPKEGGTYNFHIEKFQTVKDQLINWVYPEDNGIIWLPTSDGLIRYDQNKEEIVSQSFDILLRNVKTIDGTVISAGRSEFQNIPEISYDDNSLSFQYAIPAFESGIEVQYQTLLEGFDDKFSEWTKKTEKEYTNLHEGTYTFRVRATTGNGAVKETTGFQFTILPPIHRTIYAYVFYVIIAGLLIWLIVRLRTAKLKKQRLELENTINERTKELSQRVEELAVINSVQQGLVAEMDLQGIYNLVGDRIQDIFDAQVAGIATFDYSRNYEIFHYLFENGEKHYPKPRPMDSYRHYLVKHKEPLVINPQNVAEVTSRGFDPPKAVPGTQMPKSLVYMPLVVGANVTGYITLQNLDRENAFTEADINLLGTLANSMSVALQNARLFSETQQRAAEMASVTKVSNALASQLDLDALIQMVGDLMKELFDANIVFLAFHDKETNIINFPYQYGDEIAPIKYGEGLTSSIIKTGEPALINQDVNARYAELGIERTGKEAASFLGVPIITGKDVIGVISVQSTEQENRFDEDDMRLLSTIASNVGVAIHNATLFENTLKAQAEAEEARRNAEEANEAKSAFLSTVSHELRTPLTSVIGFAKIIRKRLSDKIFPLVNNSDGKTNKIKDQIAQNLNVVVSEGERLTTLINDVLDLAKIEAGKMEWHIENVDMGSVIDQALAATASVFDSKKLKLKKKLGKEIPSLKGDRDKLIQVLINLLSNAAKFTDQGEVVCSAGMQNNEFVITISDTGMGISREDQPKVFDKFKQVGDTLTDKPKGTGLGLPISKEIIEYHGGRIWVESEVGKGSKFSFSLPVSGKLEATFNLDELVEQLKKQVLRTAPHRENRKQSILVVDDEKHIRDLLKQELSESGYIVRQASNGKEAIDAVRRELPDLLILDVMMPEMNGFDVAAVLKNDPLTMDVPILILSIVQDKERGYRLGVDRYLTKPIDTEKLFAEIGSLLEQGKSKRKVMIVDEDASTARTLAEVLQTRGYTVVESNGSELLQKAIDSKPDIIILNSLISKDHEMLKTIRFEKGLENVLFMMYQ